MAFPDWQVQDSRNCFRRFMQQENILAQKEKNGVRINSTIAYVSGDRTKEGVFPLWDIMDNILVANLDRVKVKFC